MEPLYSEQEYAQFRGPSTSDKYNERVENLYKDLMALSNKTGLAMEDLISFYQRQLKGQLSLGRALDDLEERVEALENGDLIITFNASSQIDDDRFNETDFAITTDERCSWDSEHNLITLPKIESSSFSKLKLINTDGSSVIPSSFEAIANGVESSADSISATLETNDIYNAVLQEIGTIWERRVVATSANINGAEVIVFVRLPTDLVVNENTNCVIIHPFPILGTELKSVQYTTDTDVALNSTDTYQPINSDAMYDGVNEAIGWVPPGGWTGDAIPNCGSKIFYFDPQTVTGLRIVLRQPGYYVEDGRYIYSYGLSKLDARFVKFAETGRTMIRFDAPGGEVIESINNVTPNIYNVLEAEVPNIFSYRVIYETAYNSGIYTTTAVPDAARVWIEVTMSKTLNNGTPALSGLTLDVDFN